jgi:Fe-S cluster biogenesis protein NfuA
MTESTSQKIEALLAKVRPYIKMHGGDVQLLHVKNGTVTMRISGACADCKLSDLTYNNMVAGLLKDEVPEIKEILIEK